MAPAQGWPPWQGPPSIPQANLAATPVTKAAANDVPKRASLVRNATPGAVASVTPEGRPPGASMYRSCGTCLYWEISAA